MTYLSGSLYLFGGRDATKTYHNDLWKCDTTTGQWSQLAPTGTAPSTRSEHSMFSHNNLIYIYAGWNGTTYYGDMFIYNPTTQAIIVSTGLTANPNAWTKVPALGTTRYGFAYAVVGTSFYMFGGMRNGKTQSDTRVFSLTTSTWTNTYNNLFTARYRWSATTTTANTIALYGGNNGTASLPGLLLYNTTTHTITTPTTTGTSPGLCAGYSLFSIGTTIYLYGGYTTAGTTNNSLFTCDTSVSSPTWTNPSNSLLSYSRCFCASATNGSTFYIDDGSSSNALTTTYSETWSIAATSLVKAQFPTKQIHVNSTSFTLAGVVFSAFLNNAFAAIRVSVTQSSASGTIVSLKGLRVVS